jgi:hypothetical protein
METRRWFVVQPYQTGFPGQLSRSATRQAVAHKCVPKQRATPPWPGRACRVVVVSASSSAQTASLPQVRASTHPKEIAHLWALVSDLKQSSSVEQKASPCLLNLRTCPCRDICGYFPPHGMDECLLLSRAN